jgi:hypothetical protein
MALVEDQIYRQIQRALSKTRSESEYPEFDKVLRLYFEDLNRFQQILNDVGHPLHMECLYVIEILKVLPHDLAIHNLQTYLSVTEQEEDVDEHSLRSNMKRQ